MDDDSIYYHEAEDAYIHHTYGRDPNLATRRAGTRQFGDMIRDQRSRAIRSVIYREMPEEFSPEIRKAVQKWLISEAKDEMTRCLECQLVSQHKMDCGRRFYERQD